MSRPKPTPEEAEAIASRIERYGRADADFSDVEMAELRRRLEAKLLERRKPDREFRRRQKAGQPGG
jgi:hypothetical protein